MLTEAEAEFLVQLVRKVLTHYVVDRRRIEVPSDVPPSLEKKAGVFITLYEVDDNGKQLKGCMGVPLPENHLIQATIEAALLSSTKDFRFEPVTLNEIDRIMIKVCVLSPPELIQVNSPLEYPKRVEVGQDGLIVRWHLASGLLLPELPIQFGWDSQDFLTYACMKAGPPPDCWLTPEVKIYKFQTDVCEEAEPGGSVVVH